MAYSKELIYNIALKNLGVTAPIQNSLQADPRAVILNDYYEMARDTVLESHDWGFAVNYVTLANSVDNVVNPNFEYAFNFPNDCISPRAIIDPSSKDEKKFDPSTNSAGEKLILTNINPCILRYTKRIENEALYSAPFVASLGFYLAYLSAQAITGSANKKNTNLQDYSISIRNAIVTDARKLQIHDQDNKDYTDAR